MVSEAAWSDVWQYAIAPSRAAWESGEAARENEFRFNTIRSHYVCRVLSQIETVRLRFAKVAAQSGLCLNRELRCLEIYPYRLGTKLFLCISLGNGVHHHRGWLGPVWDRVWETFLLGNISDTLGGARYRVLKIWIIVTVVHISDT